MQIKEIIIQSYNELPAVIAGGAKRVLLVADLAAGGVTPSFGTIAETTQYAHEHNVIISVLVRPRPGSAVYSDAEIKIMDTDLLHIQQIGVDAVAFGAMTNDGQLDEEAMTNLVAAAGGMALGFSTGLSEPLAVIDASQIKWLSDNDFSRYYMPLDLNQPLTSGIISQLTETKMTLAASQLQLIPTNFKSKAERDDLLRQIDFNQLAILPE